MCPEPINNVFQGVLTGLPNFMLSQKQIEEQVLPQKYQRFITHDINRILRELAGTGDKKDSAVGIPSSPMLHHQNGVNGGLNGLSSVVSHLSLDTNNATSSSSASTGSPKSHARTNSLSRTISRPDWNGEDELPFKGSASKRM